MAVWDLNSNFDVLCIQHADILKKTYLCQVSDTGSPEPLVFKTALIHFPIYYLGAVMIVW